MLTELQQYDLLLVSDLHLSEGLRPQTKRYSPKEDFFFDHQFARFLSYHQSSRQKKWHLIIAGDCLDLLQVTSCEDAPPPLQCDDQNPEFGLDCGEAEAVYKLGKVADGHQEFFNALANFIVEGNMLTIIKGNHDVEFHYRRVQEAFIQRIKAAYGSEAGSDSAKEAGKINSNSVLFADWFYYEKGLIWVEHGNQYDETNAFKYYLCPLLPESPGWPPARKDEIDLPWGSMFVRYLFNKIEAVEPFADNIKPQTEFLRWLFKKHPATALRFAVSDAGVMLRKIRRAWNTPGPGAYAAREHDHNAKLADLASVSEIPRPDLSYISDLRAKSILKETSSLKWRLIRGILRWRLLRPLLFLAAVLTVVSGVVAVSPLLAAVLPNIIRGWLWDRWIAGPNGAAIQATVSVIRWLVFPIVVLAAGMGLRWLLKEEEKKRPSCLGLRAQEIAQRLGVRYVIMGHTHDADLQSIGSEGEEYFNTGTWTKVFSEEERLIRADVEFVFIQGLRRDGSLQLKLMEWDDEAQEPRLLKLFENEWDVQPMPRLQPQEQKAA
jgi:UDP-2,3-diacylglucosamine pyrophosphatase LpxH